jgi:hypothetical protein
LPNWTTPTRHFTRLDHTEADTFANWATPTLCPSRPPEILRNNHKLNGENTTDFMAYMGYRDILYVNLIKKRKAKNAGMLPGKLRGQEVSEFFL